MEGIKILTVIFSERISDRQVPLFRGAIMANFPSEAYLLHNHLDSKFRYSYPLVQYKRIGGHPAITSIGEGMALFDALGKDSHITLRLGHDEPKTFTVAEMRHDTADFEMGDELLSYRMHRWLPLNQHNHREYTDLQGLADKVIMLEKILVGNILSLTKGLNCRIDRELICQIKQMREPTVADVKGVKMLCFDSIEFCANILLPDYIGLGKNVSKGYGVIASLY